MPKIRPNSNNAGYGNRHNPPPPPPPKSSRRFPVAARVLIIVAIVVFVLIYLNECRYPYKDSVAVAIVIAQTSNSPHIEVDESIKYVFDDVNKHGGYICIISASSDPKKIVETFIEPPQSGDAATLSGRYANHFKDLETEIDEMRAGASEIDFFKSIQLAAESLNGRTGAEKCATKTLVIIGNGMSTSGEYINFADPDKTIIPSLEAIDIDLDKIENMDDLNDMISDFADKNITDLVDHMKSKNVDAFSTFDLRGIDIYWYGIGQLTSAPQMEIPSKDQACIKKLWTTIFVTAGADFNPQAGFISYHPAGEPNLVSEGYSPVKTIAFEEDKITFTPLVFEEPVTIPEDVISFLPDTAEFAEPEKASIALSEYNEALIESNQKMVILGTTATGDPQRCRNLSRERAERVKRELVDQGVPPENLVTIGGGIETSYYEDDNGTRNTEIAKKNRAVHLIPYDSEEAQALIAKFG